MTEEDQFQFVGSCLVFLCFTEPLIDMIDALLMSVSCILYPVSYPDSGYQSVMP